MDEPPEQGRDIRVLLVDDERALARTVGEAIAAQSGDIEVVTESSPGGALDRLGSERVDCVVSDYDMPGTNGLELLEAVREERPDLPFVLFTGKGSEEIASEAISAGVTDYLQKGGSDQYDILANRIENAVARYRADRARDHARRELRESERWLRNERDRIQSLHDAAVELAGAETREEVAGRTVEAADGLVDVGEYSVRLRNGDSLVTEALSDGVPVVGHHEETPLDAHEDLAVEAYGFGESTLVEDLRETAVSPEGEFGGALFVPIGDHGIVQAVAETPGAFDEHDRELVELLAAYAAASLERIDREVALRSRERELERQNERLSTFASVVSHDLRNPLSVVRGCLERARATGEDDAFEEADRGLQRATELIDDVLQLARGGEHVEDPDLVVLSALARDAWANVETGDASLTVEEGSSFQADRGQAKRLLENLFTNAVEHGSTGDRTGPDDAREGGTDDGLLRVTVGATDGGFFVADDGPGIDPGRRDAVLEPGVSEDVDGTGLGMAIVRRIADAHGWTVEVTESEAGGARIEFGGVEGG